MFFQFTGDSFDLFLLPAKSRGFLGRTRSFLLSNKNLFSSTKQKQQTMKKSTNHFADSHRNHLRLLRLPVILSCIIVFFSTQAVAQLAPVNPPTGGFRIDGGLKANTLTLHEGDWVYGAGGTGDSVISYGGIPFNATTTKLIRDQYNSSSDLIFSGSSFSDNPNTPASGSGGWKWTSGTASNKCDINNALFFSTTSANNKWVILGGDRLATTGTSYIDFEFYQGDLTRNADGTFSSVVHGGGSLAATGGRTPGDFVLSMEYSSGGTNATVHYYSWDNSGGWKYVEHPIPAPGGVVSAFGATNGVATDVPFGAFGATSYIPFAFVEAAVNVDAILSGQCQSLSIHTIFVKTKASDSYNAALKDFVEPQPVSFVFGTAGLNYGGTNFCHTGTQAPTVPASPQGTFTASPNTLVIDPSTGVINLGTSPVGSYTVTYTPSGGVCLQPATASITINAIPSASISGTITVCKDATAPFVVFTGSGGTRPYTFSYNTGGGTLTRTTTGSFDTARIAVPTGTAGAFVYTLTGVSDANCSNTANGSATVTVNPLAVVDQPGNQVVCNNTSTTLVTFSGTNATSYNWTNNTTSIGLAGSGTGNIVAFTATNSGSSAVVATITVTPRFTGGGINCDGASKTFTITVNPTPDVTQPSNQVVCNNTSTTLVTFSGTGATSFNWTNNTPSIGLLATGSGNIAAFTATNSGSSAVVATITVTPRFSGSGVNCDGTAKTFTITVNPKPFVANQTPTALCSPGSVSLTAASFTGASNIIPAGTTYSWGAPTGSGFTGGAAGSGSSFSTGTLTNTTASTVTAVYTVTPTAGAAAGSCVGATFTISVTLNPKPFIAAQTPAAVCSPGSVTLSSFTGANNIIPTGTTYSWAAPTGSGFTGGASGSGSSFSTGTLTNTTNSAATATYTVTPTGGAAAGSCVGASFTVTVIVNPKPAIANKTATICSGSAFSVTPTNGGGDIVPAGTTYTWSAPVISNSAGNITGGSAQATGQSSISQTLTNTTNSAQTATYTVTPTAGTCPGATFTVIVTVNPSLSANVTYNPPNCDEDTFSVTVVSPNPGATYTIVNKNGVTMPNVRVNHGAIQSSYIAPNSINFSFTNIPAGSGYQVTATIGSCSSSTNSCGTASVNSAVNQNGAALRTTTQTLQLEGSTVSIKAYPNPYNDKVNFVITSPQSGNGSLEVVNMLGQKLKTVYEGHIVAGSQSFEMSLNKQQASTLIYIFRMGDKQVTGKLLQLPQ